jgi:hypothetical protein
VSTTDAFLAPVATEVLLTALAQLRMNRSPAALRIGSPWLSDAPLFPGIFSGSFPYLLPGIRPSEVASMATFVRTFCDNGGEVSLLVQGYDPKDWPAKLNATFNEIELTLLSVCLDAGAEVLLGRGFHDKFVVVPDVVISGSANVTYSGLYRNRERLCLHTRSSVSHDYATSLAVCENHIETARRAGPCHPPAQPAGIVTPTTISEIRKCYRAFWK